MMRANWWRETVSGPILIDQGTGDQFLAEGQLLPEKFSAAAAKSGQKLTLRCSQATITATISFKRSWPIIFSTHAKILSK